MRRNAAVDALPIYLAHRLVERQSNCAATGGCRGCGRTAKSQVTIKYVDSKPDSIETVVLSTQHQPGLTHKQIEEAVIEQIIKPVLPKNLIKGQNQISRSTLPAASRSADPRATAGSPAARSSWTLRWSARTRGGAFSGKTRPR